MASKAVFHSNLTGLYRALIDQLEGESDFSAAGVAMFTSDASNYRQVPLGVVFPKNESDIENTVKLCRQQQVPVLMRGAGTSQNGQTVNQAVILDCSRFMNQVLSIDVESRTALVQPGIVCDALKAAAEPHGLHSDQTLQHTAVALLVAWLATTPAAHTQCLQEKPLKML